MRRITLMLAVLLLVAACGGGDGDDADGVASLGGDASSSDQAERIGFEEGLLQFTTCMRTEGIDLPDIQIDADGRPILNTEVLDGVDTQSDEFSAAFLICVPILAQASPVQVGSDPELQAAVQDTLRDFSACMRQNGVENFPDPAPGFDGSGSPFPITALDTSDPDVDDAFQECSELLSFPEVG